MTHSLHASQRNLNIFIIATGYVCVMYLTSSIPSALHVLGVSSYSVLFLVNSALKFNQLNINLYVLRSRNRDFLEYCNSIYILVRYFLALTEIIYSYKTSGCCTFMLVTPML